LRKDKEKEKEKEKEKNNEDEKVYGMSNTDSNRKYSNLQNQN
jgi:hypothetical protein